MQRGLGCIDGNSGDLGASKPIDLLGTKQNQQGY